MNNDEMLVAVRDALRDRFAGEADVVEGEVLFNDDDRNSWVCKIEMI